MKNKKKLTQEERDREFIKKTFNLVECSEEDTMEIDFLSCKLLGLFDEQ